MIKITIQTGNAAFQDDCDAEVARILRDLADKLETRQLTTTLRDINGNVVGEIDYTNYGS